MRATRRIHTCDLPYRYVRHDSFTCVTWLAVRSPSDVISNTADCNRLRQTATDCNRLQQTATDCNRLQRIATANKIARLQTSYPVTVFGTSRTAVDATDYNRLQQTATDCNRLQQTATDRYCKQNAFSFRSPSDVISMTRSCV